MTAAQLPKPDVEPQAIDDQDRTVLVISFGRSCRAGVPWTCMRDSTAAAESSETHHPSVVLAGKFPPALLTTQSEAM
jgi:hypothetical protein